MSPHRKGACNTGTGHHTTQALGAGEPYELLTEKSTRIYSWRRKMVCWYCGRRLWRAWLIVVTRGVKSAVDARPIHMTHHATLCDRCPVER